VKTALFDRKGKLIHKVIRDYQLDTPNVGWCEVAPDTYWNAVMEGFRQMRVNNPRLMDRVRAISGCSQGETVIFLDKDDRPVRPAIVWLDNRAKAEVEELKRIVTGDEFYRTTGIMDFDPMYSVFKILWIKKNEGEAFKKINKLMMVEDFIVYKLTGNLLSSASLLSTSGLIDIHVDEGSIAGTIKADIAQDIGISKKTVVVKGSMDQNTSAVGAGNIKPGIITETTGTALAIAITVEEQELSEKVGLPYQPHAIPQKFIYIPFAQTSGIVYKWFRDALIVDDQKKSDNRQPTFDDLNELAASVSPGSDGLVFLPFLAGAPYPENDTYAKGVFYGITLKHGRGHFVRAIMESIAHMLKKILDNVEQAGINIEEIHSMGGAARSDLWLQIKSDVCGYPIVKMKEEETSTLGAAIMSAVSIGDYASFDEAVEEMVKTGKSFYPAKNNSEIYVKNYSLYNEIYNVLKPIFRKH
jgi:xylulokinase